MRVSWHNLVYYSCRFISFYFPHALFSFAPCTLWLCQINNFEVEVEVVTTVLCQAIDTYFKCCYVYMYWGLIKFSSTWYIRVIFTIFTIKSMHAFVLKIHLSLSPFVCCNDTLTSFIVYAWAVSKILAIKMLSSFSCNLGILKQNHLQNLEILHMINVSIAWCDTVVLSLSPNTLEIPQSCTMPWLLTHWGLVTPFGDIDLGQHWLR